MTKALASILAGGSESFRKANQHLVAGQVLPEPYPVGDPYKIAQRGKDGTAKRIRQKSGDGMNRWEREYAAELRAAWDYVYREPALPLANGLKFKVDFLVVGNGGRIEGHEVKGLARPAGIAKLKMAARLYPWIKFVLVTKRRKRDGGGWAMEELLP